MEEAENAPLPLRIGALRRQKKMTQRELAKAAGIPLRTLKAWEVEKQPDSLPVVLRIAAALEVTLDQLAGVPDRDAPAPRHPQVVVDGVPYVPANGAASPDVAAVVDRVRDPAAPPARKQSRHSPPPRKSSRPSPEE